MTHVYESVDGYSFDLLVQTPRVPTMGWTRPDPWVGLNVENQPIPDLGSWLNADSEGWNVECVKVAEASRRNS